MWSLFFIHRSFLVDEHEVEELEKVFGSINDTKLCKLTQNGFTRLVTGVIEECFIDGLFRAFDENSDGLIDFKELVCALSASCRGPDTARLHCAFLPLVILPFHNLLLFY